MPFDQLPEWRELRRLPHDEQLKRLRDPAVRRRLVSATEDGAIPDGVGTEPRRPDYDKLLVLDSPTPPYRTVSAVARDRGVDPVSAMIELAVETQLDQLFLLPLTLNDPESLLRYMRHPETVMTFSDSGAHVSQVMDSSIQTHLLSYWVRDRGEFALENAVRMLTSVPASRWGFDGRGTLQPGAIADLNVFDPERVGPCLPQVTSDFPANTTRLQQRSTGFAATIVAGVPTIRNGISTGFRPGRLVRDAGIHRSVPER